jgi:hypothetical protein
MAHGIPASPAALLDPLPHALPFFLPSAADPPEKRLKHLVAADATLRQLLRLQAEAFWVNVAHHGGLGALLGDLLHGLHTPARAHTDPMRLLPAAALADVVASLYRRTFMVLLRVARYKDIRAPSVPGSRGVPSGEVFERLLAGGADGKRGSTRGFLDCRDLLQAARLYGPTNPSLAQPLLAALFLACPSYYQRLRDEATKLCEALERAREFVVRHATDRQTPTAAVVQQLVGDLAPLLAGMAAACSLLPLTARATTPDRLVPLLVVFGELVTPFLTAVQPSLPADVAPLLTTTVALMDRQAQWLCRGVLAHFPFAPSSTVSCDARGAGGPNAGKKGPSEDLWKVHGAGVQARATI